MAKYKRILLKLSGESLMGKQNFGIDPERLADYARQIKEVSEMGVEIGIVDELGNIDDAIAKAVELAGLGQYQLAYYPEKVDPFDAFLKSLDNTTEEERLIMKVRSFCSKPRIMALMDEVIIR